MSVFLSKEKTIIGLLPPSISFDTVHPLRGRFSFAMENPFPASGFISPPFLLQVYCNTLLSFYLLQMSHSPRDKNPIE